MLTEVDCDFLTSRQNAQRQNTLFEIAWSLIRIGKRPSVLARQRFADFRTVEQCDFGVGFERQRGGEASRFAHCHRRDGHSR